MTFTRKQLPPARVCTRVQRGLIWRRIVLLYWTVKTMINHNVRKMRFRAERWKFALWWSFVENLYANLTKFFSFCFKRSAFTHYYYYYYWTRRRRWKHERKFWGCLANKWRMEGFRFWKTRKRPRIDRSSRISKCRSYDLDDFRNGLRKNRFVNSRRPPIAISRPCSRRLEN